MIRILVAIAGLGILAVGMYCSWWAGFYTGADASLCYISQVEGTPTSDSPACVRLKNGTSWKTR